MTKVPASFFKPSMFSTPVANMTVVESPILTPGTAVFCPPRYQAQEPPRGDTSFDPPLRGQYPSFNGLEAIGLSFKEISVPRYHTCEVRPMKDSPGTWEIWMIFEGEEKAYKNEHFVTKSPWYENTFTEFFYNLDDKKPHGVMTYRATSNHYYRWLILNPEIPFTYSATGGQLPTAAPSSGITPRGLPNTPLNAIPTVTRKVPNQPRDPDGWGSYIDCVVNEDFEFLVDDNKKHTKIKIPFFHSMGWRLCKVGSTIRSIPMYGIMNVFSFHGAIGVRVYAPTEPGRYENWVCRGLNPYMGQTSLGKSLTSYVCIPH